MAASAASAPAARFRGLLTRVVSAAILGPLFLVAVWIGFPWIDLVSAIAAPLMIGEWLRLTRRRPAARLALVLYSIAAVLALLWLRHQPAFGRETILWIVACVWATDIGAYFIGSYAGGARLAPSISPGKTWSGLVGGASVTAVVSALCGLAVGAGETLTLALTGIGIALVAQSGDLLESAQKRRAGVKDSGRLIPGHGGILDRIDGMIAALLFVALLRLATGGEWPWA
ncbi:MAG: phosphatidate cytidylyltransferase [Proteobacteria bacterium]|nr:phosphatidate cytidylyltransferase [Pseudomonadota bacterium]